MTVKTLFFSAATIALIAANPASAQLLGGLGGSVGGTVGGTVNGTIGGTMSRARTTVDTTARARQEARIDRQLRAQQRQSAAADAQLALDSELRTRGVVNATQRGLTQVSETASGVPVFVKSEVAAPAVSVATPNVAVAAPSVGVAYPVYDRSIYYGGPDVVVIPSGQVTYYMDRQYRDLRQGMEGTGATVLKRGNDLVIQLPADVTFAFDKSDIRARFVRPLSALARTLGDYPGTDVEIIGHTDSVGSDTYNLGLSERRGRSVADFLAARRTAPDRMVVEAMGESEPVATNATVEGRAANRRVEIILHPRAG